MKKFTLLALMGAMAFSLGGWARTWTNTDGKTLEAELVRVKGDTVYLKIAKSGKIHPLEISMLSADDQEYIKQYEKDEAARQKAEKLSKRRAKWLDEYDDAKAEAEEYDLPIMLLYTAPAWCGYCVRLEDNILSQKLFEEYADRNLVLFLADFSENRDAENWKEDYPQLIKDFPCSGYPCAYLMTADGKQLGQISGYDSNWSIQDYINKLDGFRK